MASDNASPKTSTEWWRVDTATLHARKQELEVIKRQVDAEQNVILAEINARGVRGCSGHSTLAALIFEDFRVTEKEAHARADRVLALHPGPAVGGDPEPPLAPLTAQAAAEGVIGGLAFDGSRGTAQNFGDLLHAQVAVESQHEGGSLPRRHGGQRGPHRDPVGVVRLPAGGFRRLGHQPEPRPPPAPFAVQPSRNRTRCPGRTCAAWSRSASSTTASTG